jgi:DNA polymerase-4
MLPNKLRFLFLDLNSYFASVEQQLEPHLRGKPVAVVPVETDATCAIAASYEAKAYGIKTGTMIYEAKKPCPELICVKARHEAYVDYHHKIKAEIERHIPIYKIESIDELSCELIGSQCNEEKVLAIAHAIKAGMQTTIGQYIRCSIGLSTNRFLAKVATNLQKSDGLVVLYPHQLPECIGDKELTFLPGVGHNMERRLLAAGVPDMPSLWRLSPKHMRKLWSGVGGERYWYMLRGYELPQQETTRSTVGHSHVLEPEWRPVEQAREVAKRLLLKAASRLRRLGYHAGEMYLSIRIEHGPRVSISSEFYRACDNMTLAFELLHLWDELMASYQPVAVKKVSVSLFKLVKNETLQPELLDALPLTDVHRRQKYTELSGAMDKLNERFGRDTIVLGAAPKKVRSFSGTKIAFTRIPDRQEFHE